MNEISPGWYPDPDNSLQFRYWDGSQWTESKPVESLGTNSWGQSEVTRRRLQNQEQDRTLGKWVVGIIIFLVLIFGLHSCGSRGWQMGVDGNGYQVTCQDGTTSMSGGIQGACSHHGGVAG